MQVKSRDIERTDRDNCLNLLRDHRPFFGKYMHERGLLDLLDKIWDRLLVHPAISHGISEDLLALRSKRLLVFGFVGFVRDSWVRDFLQNPYPVCGEAVFQDVLNGTSNALLTAQEVRSQNSGNGLFSLTLFDACPRDHRYESLEGLYACVEAYAHAIKGFHLRETMMELSGERERRLFLSAGVTRVRHLLENCFPNARPLPERGDEPILVGLTREEAQQYPHVTSVSAQFFRRYAIRYGFSESQQRFLRLAMKYPKDEMLLAALRALETDVKDDAIRRRWGRIFHRVLALQPPDSPVILPSGSPAGKRTQVLMHFAKNFHELRPHAFHIPLQARKGRSRAAAA